MKPKNYTASRFRASRGLSVLTLVFTASLPLHADSWTNTGAPGVYSWLDSANWNTLAPGPSGIDASALLSANITSTPTAVQGTQSISLNSPVILGNLVMGDLNTTTGNGNGFFNVQNGTGGSLTFQTAVGNAKLTRTISTPGSPPTYTGTTDTISATVILASSLDADIRNGTINITGQISGGGSITRSGSISQLTPPTTGGGTLGLSNGNNSYSGDTSIEHGTLSLTLNGNVGVSTNSVIGNAATPVFLGTPNTASGGNGTSVLNCIAGNDTGNYQIDRDIDVTGSTSLTTASAFINFNGNGAGVANTNTLTLAGQLFLGSRNTQFVAVRGGMTLNMTGDISGPGAGAGTIRWNGFPPDPGNPNVDGRGAGTVRFSDVPRAYSNANNLTMGTIVIAGDVPASGASPIGITSMALSLGSGGNIVGSGNFSGGAAANRDTSPDTIRALYLETPGATYARTMAPGNGSVTIATGVTGASTGSTAIPASYGTNSGAAATAADRVSVINGYQFGGLNTTGTVTFSGNISSGSPDVGSSVTNPIINAINMALIAKSGGTVVFSGIINDTSSVVTNTRVTINQFRNHPNLDGSNNTTNLIGADGIKDAAANQLIGTATGGTVVVSGNNTYVGGTEVLGGILSVNNPAGSGTGTGAVKVVSGAKLGGSGRIDGAATLDSGAGLAFTVNTLVADHDSFDFSTDLTLLGSTAVTVLDGIGAEIGSYTLATVGGTLTGTVLPTPILPAGMSGTVSVVGGNQLVLNVTGVVSADYIDWISSYPTITGLDRAGSADPDGDGQKNPQEYAFGLDPTSGSSVSPITSQLNKTTGQFSYTRRLTSLTGLAYTYQYSTTLIGAWTTFTPSATSSGGGTPNETITATVPAAILSANPTLFIRVVAQ